MFQANAILSIMELFKWRQAVLLTEKDSYSVGLSFDINLLSKSSGIHLQQFFYETFTPDLYDRIRSTGYKIIIVIGTVYTLPQNVEDLTSDNGYIWIITEHLAIINEQVGFPKVYHNGFVTKPPLLITSQLTDFIEEASTIDTHIEDRCETYVYQNNAYTTHIMNAFDAIFNAAISCYVNHVDACDKNLLLEILEESQVDGLTEPIYFNDSKGPAIYEIYTINSVGKTEPFFLWSGSCIATSVYCKKFSDPEFCVSSILTQNVSDGCVLQNEAVWPGDRPIPTDGYFIMVINLDHELSVASIVVGGLLLCMLSISISYSLKNSHRKTISEIGLFFMLFVMTGLSVMSFYLMISVGIPSKALCTLRIWMGYLGYVMAITPFIIKARKFRKQHKNMHTTLTLPLFLKLYALFLAPMIIILIIWSAVRLPTILIEEINGATHMTCQGGGVFAYISLGYCCLLTVLNLIFSLQIDRNKVSYAKWSKIIAYILFLNGLLGFALGYQIIGSVDSGVNMYQSHITTLVFISSGIFATLLCLMLPTLKQLYEK